MDWDGAAGLLPRAEELIRACAPQQQPAARLEFAGLSVAFLTVLGPVPARGFWFFTCRGALSCLSFKL